MPGASGDWTQPQDPNEVVGQNFATQLSDFLKAKSAATMRVSPFGVGTLGVPQFPTPEQASAPVATTGLAGAVRHLVPDRFANAAQGAVEGIPRMCADVGALLSGVGTFAGLADMGLQGYTSARHAGVGEAGSLGAGAIGAGSALAFGPAEQLGSAVGGSAARAAGLGDTGAMLSKFLGGQAGILGTGEAQNVAQRSIETGSPIQALKESITPEAIFGQLAGQAPFAAMGAYHLTQKPVGINSAGRLVEAGSATAPDQVAQTEAMNSTESDPQTQILNRFLGSAQQTAADSTTSNPLPEGPTPTLDPSAPNPEAKLASETFDKGAGFSTPEEATPKTPSIAPESPSSAEPDFSLINPLGADFSSKKAMTPPVILNSLLNGEIRPTNAPDNLGAMSAVDALQRAFVTPESQENGYVDMNKVGQAAELAGIQQQGAPLTQAQQSAWSKLSPVEQQGAHVAAKILNDPFQTLGADPIKGGLDPRKWDVDPDFGPESFMRSVYQGAANMTAKWNRPITSVEDAAALVKDTNGFTKNIQDCMSQNGFGEELQKQMTNYGVFQPITKESLAERYGTFMNEYLTSPDAEAAARALQWVKNQTWLNARAAKEVMLQKPQFANPELAPESTKLADKDMALEQPFQEAMAKTPAPMQDLLQQQYLRARQEKGYRPAGPGASTQVWSLNDFRRGVTEAINQLPPEQMERLNSLPLGTNGKVDMSQARSVLDSIPVKQGKTMTNLGKVVFEPKWDTVAGAASGRDKTVNAGLQPPREELDPTISTGQRESSVMKQFFDGTPRGPGDVLGEMSPRQLQTAFVAAMDDKAKSVDNSKVWSNRMARYAQMVGKTPNEVRADGSGDAWMREFLRVDAEGDLGQKKAWADANGFPGQKWLDVSKQMLSTDAGKRTMWKARMLGLQPKDGVSSDQVKTAMGGPESAGAIPTQAPVKTDFVGFIRKDLLNRGYQPELADTIAKYAKNMADHFWWIDNADFATLTDREGAAQKFYKQMQVLGMHLPDQTIVNGKPIKNPMIALMTKDLVQREGYAPLNTFLKLTGLGHEAFHNLQTQVVDNPDFKPTNEDTQTVIDSVHSMHAVAAQMSPEDRAMSASTLVDLMVPPKYSRDKNRDFLPEVKGLVNAVSQNPKEYSAFMFQMATAGLGSRLSEFEGGSGVPRGDKIAKDYQDHLSWFSHNTIAFMRGQFRYMGDMLDSLQKVLDDPDFRAEKGLTYTQNEQRTKSYKQGDSVSLQQHAEGQSTETNTAPGTVSRPATFTTPPTAGVGTRTRAVAEAALRIARSQPQAAPGPLGPQAAAEAPTHYQVLRKLAQVIPQVEKATTTIKQLINNLENGNFSAAKTVDLSDVQGAKDFMASIPLQGPVQPGKVAPVWTSAVDLAEAKTPQEERFGQNLATRFLAPMQYRTADLARRGNMTPEIARQNIDRIQSNTNTIANNIRGPIIARTGMLGKYGLDPSTGYFKFFHDNMGDFDTAANLAMSKIALRQQEMKGVDARDPKMQQAIADATKGLPPAQAQYAVSATKDLNAVYKGAMASQIKAQMDSTNHFSALLVMKQNPGKFTSDTAIQTAQLAEKAANGDLASRQQLMQLVKGGQLSPQSLSTLESVGMLGYEKVQNLTQIMQGQGNFISEGRFGRYMLFYKDAQGKNGSMGFNDPQEAKEFEFNRAKEGATEFKFVDKRDLTNEQYLASNAQGIDAIQNVVKQTFAKQLATIIKLDPQNGPTIAKALQDTADPSKAIDNYTVTDSLRKLTNFRRKLAPGREYINPIATMEEYTASTARGIARRAAKDKHALYTEEMNQAGLPDISKDLDVQMNEVLAPSNQTTNKLTTIGTAAYIGGDVARSLVDSTLGFTVGIPTLMQEGINPVKAHGYYFNGMANVTKNLMSQSEFNTSADRGGQFVAGTLPTSKTMKQDVVNHYFRRMNDEGRLNRSPIVDTLLQDTQKMNLEKAARVGNYEPTKISDMLISPAYNTAKALLRMHSMLPSFNQKISADAALNSMYDKGYRGEELYLHANRMLDTMTAAAGRGNKPVGYAYLSGQGSAGSEFRRSAVSFATMMQQYGLSQTFSQAHMLKDAVGATPGISPKQRIASAQAAGYALMTTAGLAGAVGLTGVQYAFAAINKMFHHDPEADVRVALQKFYNHFISDDKEKGGLFADTAMNGLANRLTGLDFAGRSGVSSLFGISPTGDTNMFDMLGPSAGLVDQLVTGLSDVKAGKPWLGAKEISPRALKPLVEMYGNYKQFGDLRINDQDNNLIMKPGAAQAIGYGMGFAPAQVRRQRQEERLMKTSQDNFQINQDAKVNAMATSATKGDMGPALKEAYSRQFETGFNSRAFLDSVMEKSLDMQTQKDPMARGSALNAQSQDAIGSTFDNPRQSEVARLQRKSQMVMSMGQPFGMQQATPADYQRAALVDQLRQQRGMSRSEALSVIEKYFPQVGK